MTSIFFFLVALFCSLWAFTSNTNKKNKPGDSSGIGADPMAADDSFTPFSDVTSPDLPSNDIIRHYHHQQHHDHYNGHYDTGGTDSTSYDFSLDDFSSDGPGSHD